MQKSFNITKLIIFPTGTYDQMVSRPYETNLDYQTVQRFEEATGGGANTSPEAISGVASNIIRPKAQHEGAVNIPNGWGERRLRFMMEILYPGSMGADRIQILTGYTDYAGVTPSGAVDPNMRLYFNSSVELTSFEMNTPSGRRHGTRMVGAEQFVNPNWNPSAFMAGQTGFTMRPEDLFSTMESSTLEGAEVFNFRTSGSGGMKLSRRNNLLAPQYISRVMGAYRNAMDNHEMAGSSEELYHSAMGSVREREVSSNTFLLYMTKQSQLRENGCLSFGELEAMDQDLHHKTQYIHPDQRMMSMLPQAGQYEHWNGTTIETVAATMLSGSVPALLTELLMTKITFMATNETLDGNFEIKVLGLEAFNNQLDMTPYVQRFIARLEIEVMRDLTRNNQMTTMLEMSVNLLGDTHIKISMNGQPAMEYITPTFCDSLTTPVLTNSRQTLDTVSHDFETLLSHAAGIDLGTIFQNSNQGHYPVPIMDQSDNGPIDYGHSEDAPSNYNPAFGFGNPDDDEGGYI